MTTINDLNPEEMERFTRSVIAGTTEDEKREAEQEAFRVMDKLIEQRTLEMIGLPSEPAPYTDDAFPRFAAVLKEQTKALRKLGLIIRYWRYPRNQGHRPPCLECRAARRRRSPRKRCRLHRRKSR